MVFSLEQWVRKISSLSSLIIQKQSFKMLAPFFGKRFFASPLVRERERERDKRQN